MSAAPRQRSHDAMVKAINQARPSERYERDFAGLARFESHSGSRRNIQATSKSSAPIEGESAVALSKMIMTANLDRSITGICYCKGNCRSILVEDNLARRWEYLSRYHIRLLINWIVNADEFDSVGECCFHLHVVDHLRNALHHLIPGQEFAAF